MDKSLIVIPARFGSQRFPGKVLAKLGGKPVVQWVWEAAVRASLGEVIIATESAKVFDFAESIGAEAVMTSDKCRSGSDRVYEASAGTDADFIINIQGDEPFISPGIIKAVLNKLKGSPDCQIGTACQRISDGRLIDDPNCVKIAMSASGRAFYFSRAAIPFHHGLSELSGSYPYYRHDGIYIYRREALERFVKCGPSELEILERLEQLRALENGMNICVAEIGSSGPDINSPEDLARAEEYLKDGNL